MRVIHICVGLLLVLLGIAAPLALGAVTPGYDARSDFISELGQTGASRAALMNYGVFLPVGVLWAVASLILLRTMPKGSLGLTGVVLLFGNAASYIGAAFFPCDAGCPASGSFSQAMHNFSGALGYFLTPLALALIGAHLMSKGRPAFGGATLLVAAIIGAAFAQIGRYWRRPSGRVAARRRLSGLCLDGSSARYRAPRLKPLGASLIRRSSAISRYWPAASETSDVSKDFIAPRGAASSATPWRAARLSMSL